MAARPSHLLKAPSCPLRRISVADSLIIVINHYHFIRKSKQRWQDNKAANCTSSCPQLLLW